MWML
jgi:hypothetical protein